MSDKIPAEFLGKNFTWNYGEIYIKYCIKTLSGNIALCCGTLWDTIHTIGLMLQL